MKYILRLDIAGNPVDWISAHDGIRLVAAGRALAGLGEHETHYYGGYNAITGKRSRVTVSSILLTRKRVDRFRQARGYTPSLSNPLLFRRDHHQCLYCGAQGSDKTLTRDHIVPVSRGGRDRWTNVATACRRCNNAKANLTPEEWGRELLAVPFAPNLAEGLFLANHRRIIADQQAFLMARFRPGHDLLA